MTRALSLFINLSNIQHNYLYMKSITNAKVAAVVKSDAYGLGSRYVANALQDVGCKDFFVGYLEEALHLRQYGINGNIYVIYGINKGEEVYFETNGIIPVISLVNQARMWNEYAISSQKQLECVYYIDTGMNGIGMCYEDAINIANIPLDVSARYIMSHLSCSDEPENSSNANQLKKFLEYSKTFNTSNGLSLVNSSGVFLGSEYHLDMARIGKAMYGLCSTSKPNSTKSTVALYAKILQMHHIKRNGEFVGYGASYTPKIHSKIATISIGYYDGYMRSLGNKSVVCVAGKIANVVGRVSMDLVNIDVTDIKCDIGDDVEICGDNITIDDIAKAAGTINHEILTSFSGIKNKIYLP